MLRTLFCATAAAGLLLGSAGCAKTVDRYVTKRVFPHALAVPDVPKACALGASLVHPLAAVPKAGHPPHQTMVVAELTAALCEEGLAWEEELAAERARHNFRALGGERTPEIKDARLRAERAHLAAADRFFRSWQHIEPLYGPVGEGCPKLRSERDELVYLIGLVAGTLALLNDRAGGGGVGVPLDTLGKVARGAECLDNAKWWHTPGTLRAAAWAIIPGLGPEGVEPFAALEEEASAGEASGVRVARALSVLVYANADQRPMVEQGIRAHAASLSNTVQHPDWALLDEYARLVTLHESDLIWTGDEGHRTPVFGALPRGEPEDLVPPPNPFEDANPFGSEE
ncbi:MAG: hypothetical protein JRI25_03795 [Deltaproteobacteria bacterium]|nr:hypothetical protein [Deltaproteobacteria bacterium]MBW2253701.1 hypothetical protein [Deltaproteobacteria bacterium]